MILTKSGKSTLGDHLAARNFTKTGLLPHVVSKILVIV